MAMVRKMKSFLREYEEIIAYLIVGGLNTLLSWGLWLVLAHCIFDVQIIWQNLLLSIVCWLVCDGFSYVLNRIFVFKSRNPDILKEFFRFSASRVLTWLIDAATIILLINICNINKLAAKVITSAVVIILNYLFSKCMVFQKSNG